MRHEKQRPGRPGWEPRAGKPWLGCWSRGRAGWLAVLVLVLAGAGALGPGVACAQLATRVGLGWARNNINGAIFCKNSVVSRGRDQCVAYYDSARYVVLGKRQLPAGPWQAQRTPYRGHMGRVRANVASGTARPYTARWHSESKALSAFADPQWASRCRVWRMNWDSTAVRLYVDDELLDETLLSQTVNQDGAGFNPMQPPHYLLLNLALGGDNGGKMLPASLPARYEIDYVCVYQRAN